MKAIIYTEPDFKLETQEDLDRLFAIAQNDPKRILRPLAICVKHGRKNNLANYIVKDSNGQPDLAILTKMLRRQAVFVMKARGTLEKAYQVISWMQS